MHPEFHIFGLHLQTFGLMLGLGFIGAGILIAQRLKELGKPADWSYEIAYSALIGGLVGARVWFIAENWSKAEGDLIENIFTGEGLVWYGGLIGGTLGVFIWAQLRRGCSLSLNGLLGLAAPALALGQAIGRIGCQLSGDGDYGKASDLPWAMAYPDGTVPTDERVHPTPVYETLTLTLIAVVLWRLRNRVRPGALFALYLVLVGIERFLVEFVRRNPGVFIGLSVAQLTSLGLVALGGVILYSTAGSATLPTGEEVVSETRSSASVSTTDEPACVETDSK